MASQAREIINHRYYRETEGGIKQKLEEILIAEKRKNPSRIPYFFSASQVYSGKFMLGYMPRNRPRVEYVTVCPEGFRYRGRVHATVNGLLRWFKEHFRDPIPGIFTIIFNISCLFSLGDIRIFAHFEYMYICKIYVHLRVFSKNDKIFP